MVLPVVIGRRLMLNPVIVFLWLIFWAWLWGVPGALMAVPLLAIVKIVCRSSSSLLRRSRGVYRPMIRGAASAFARAYQHYRADNQPGGKQNARRDRFFSEKITK